jgi:type I restriction enzyme S subunit
LADEIGRADALYDAATSTLWLDDDGTEAAIRPLDDVMHVDIQRIPLEPTETYQSAGVLNAGKGLIDKGSFQGSDTEYRTMNLLRTNQVVMRKLTAWEGPITVVPSAFDGYVASTEFPTFTLSADVAPEWMRHVCRTRRLWHEMKNRVTGSVQRRKRLNPDQLLSVALPIPPRGTQELAAMALNSLDAEIIALRDELAHLRSFRAVLLTSLLSQKIEIPESYDDILEKVS